MALPFASSSSQSFFDVKWQDKQEFAFTQLLNYFFSCSLYGGAPADAACGTGATNLKTVLREALRSDAAASSSSSAAMVRVAPTREEQVKEWIGKRRRRRGTLLWRVG